MRIPWIRRIRRLKEGEGGEPQPPEEDKDQRRQIADLSCEVRFDFPCDLNRALSLKIEKLPDIFKQSSGILGVQILPELGVTIHWVRDDSKGLSYFYLMEETKSLRRFLGVLKRTHKSYDLMDRSPLQLNPNSFPHFPFSGETDACSNYSFVGQTSVFSSNEELAKLRNDPSQPVELALPLPFDNDSSGIFDGGWLMVSATRGENHIALIFSMDSVTYDVQDLEFEFHKRGSDIRDRGNFPLGN